jgi:membrane protein DedA with SNARE-associated domain
MISQALGWIASLVTNLIQSAGIVGVFALMTLESANIPIPSEIIMPFAGFLVSKGVFGFWPVVLAGTFGNLVGSMLSYGLASLILEDRSKISFLKSLISKSFLEKAHRFFEKYGSASVFFSRILPILRTFISLPAGLGKMNFARFCALTLAGSFIWSLALTYLGKVLGENWMVLEKYFREFNIVIVLIIVLAGVYWVKHHFGLSSRNKKQE